MEKAIFSDVMKNKSAIVARSVADALKKCLVRLTNDVTIAFRATQASDADLEAKIARMQEIKRTVTVKLVALDDKIKKFKTECHKVAEDIFAKSRHDTETSIEIMFKANYDKNSSHWKKFCGGYAYYVDGIDKSAVIECKTQADLAKKIGDINQKVAQVVSQKWDGYLQDLLQSMRTKRGQVQQELCVLAQPILTEVVAAGASGFSINLGTEELELPVASTKQKFAEEMDAEMKKLVEAKKELVSKTRSVGKTKKGKCNKTIHYSENENYTVSETKGYKVTQAQIIEQWMARVKSETDVSFTSASKLIDQSVVAECMRVKQDIIKRIDDLTAIFQKQISDNKLNKEQNAAKIAALEAKLQGLNSLVERLQAARQAAGSA